MPLPQSLMHIGRYIQHISYRYYIGIYDITNKVIINDHLVYAQRMLGLALKQTISVRK